MSGLSAMRPGSPTAPPSKRANSDGIPVRLSDGALIARVSPELADRLHQSGAAESFRNGSRRYLRLHQGIGVPRTERGWDIIEFLRMWHGDERAADAGTPFVVAGRAAGEAGEGVALGVQDQLDGVHEGAVEIEEEGWGHASKGR